MISKIFKLMNCTAIINYQKGIDALHYKTVEHLFSCSLVDEALNKMNNNQPSKKIKTFI